MTTTLPKFTIQDSLNDPEALAEKMFFSYLEKYEGDFQLLLAVANLPIQTTAEDDPSFVVRLAANPPMELIHSIPVPATAWAFGCRREDDGWRVVWCVPMFGAGRCRGSQGLWLFDLPVSDELFRKVA